MAEELVLPALSKHWGAFLLRGIAAIAFGILTFARPGIALATLVLFWGVYVLVDGVLGVIGGIQSKVWSLVLWGIVGIIAGIVTFRYPGLTALVLLYMIAAWAVVTGIIEIWLAIKLRKEIEHEWLMALAGIISVLFGAFLFARPGAGALSVVLIIGAYAILFGILLVALAFKLRSTQGRLTAA